MFVAHTRRPGFTAWRDAARVETAAACALVCVAFSREQRDLAGTSGAAASDALEHERRGELDHNDFSLSSRPHSSRPHACTLLTRTTHYLQHESCHEETWLRSATRIVHPEARIDFNISATSIILL